MISETTTLAIIGYSLAGLAILITIITLRRDSRLRAQKSHSKSPKTGGGE
jgi:ABC-type uncharacterized transport system permease subunit